MEERHKNMVYNNIEVLSFSHYQKTTEFKNNRFKQNAIYNCKCFCGNEFKTRASYIKTKRVKSCGCLIHEYKEKPIFRKEGNPLLLTLYNKYTRSANKRNLDFNLTLIEFEYLTKQNCYYCNTPPIKELLELRKDRINRGATWLLEHTYKYNGIDRVDSSLGYFTNNCVSCCTNCNIAKNDLSTSIFLNLVKKIYEFKKLDRYGIY